MFIKSDGRLMNVNKVKVSSKDMDYEFEDMNDDNVSIGSRFGVSHKRCFTLD